jgi:hypothetical protein
MGVGGLGGFCVVCARGQTEEVGGDCVCVSLSPQSCVFVCLFVCLFVCFFHLTLTRRTCPVLSPHTTQHEQMVACRGAIAKQRVANAAAQAVRACLSAKKEEEKRKESRRGRG